MDRTQYIEGKWYAGEGEAQAVTNPATGDLLYSLAEASDAQVDMAVNAAASGFGIRKLR